MSWFPSVNWQCQIKAFTVTRNAYLDLRKVSNSPNTSIRGSRGVFHSVVERLDCLELVELALSRLLPTRVDIHVYG
jgi:hypothetical protein